MKSAFIHSALGNYILPCQAKGILVHPFWLRKNTISWNWSARHSMTIEMGKEVKRKTTNPKLSKFSLGFTLINFKSHLERKMQNEVCVHCQEDQKNFDEERRSYLQALERKEVKFRAQRNVMLTHLHIDMISVIESYLSSVCCKSPSAVLWTCDHCGLEACSCKSYRYVKNLVVPRDFSLFFKRECRNMNETQIVWQKRIFCGACFIFYKLLKNEGVFTFQEYNKWLKHAVLHRGACYHESVLCQLSISTPDLYSVPFKWELDENS